MKTAISIPDGLFKQADRLAKKLGMSRSQLYTEAVEKLVKEKTESDVTRRLNEFYGNGGGSPIDPAVQAASIRTILEATKDDTW